MKRYKYVFNLEVYKPKLWERLLLTFIPLKTEASERMIFWYKEFRDRLYVYSHAHIVYKDDSPSMYDCQEDTEWNDVEPSEDRYWEN